MNSFPTPSPSSARRCARLRDERRDGGVPARRLHVGELQALGHRLAAARLVDTGGVPYAEIAAASAARPPPSRASRTGCATARAATGWCSTAPRGRRRRRVTPLLRLALPSKGRLAEPSYRLFRDAGMPVEPDGRRLRAAPARARPRRAAGARRRHPRAARRPRGRRRHRRREPGRRVGRRPRRRCCGSASAAAGWRWRPRPTARRRAPRDLRGLRIATSYPAHRRRLPRATAASRRS